MQRSAIVLSPTAAPDMRSRVGAGTGGGRRTAAPYVRRQKRFRMHACPPDDVMTPVNLFFEGGPAVLTWRAGEDQPVACVFTRHGAFQVRLRDASPDMRRAINDGDY